MKILAPVLVLSLCCAVPSYGKVVEIDPGQTVTVNDGECEEGYSFKDATGTLLLNLSAAPSCTITGAGTVKKTSSSDWTLTTALPDFTGEYHLLGSGIVSIGVNKALGSTSAGAKGVFVHDGATLKITNASVGFSDRPLNLTGSGVDGCGALWVAAGVSGGTAFSKYINLPEGDARIAVDGNPSGFGSTQIYTYSGSISLNGHTLTKAGTGGWYLYMAKVKDSGTILVEGAADKSKRGYLCVRQWSPVGTAGKLTVRTKNLATLDFWDAEPSEQKYALEVDGELKLTRACGNALVWSGSVSFLSEGSKLVVAPAAPSGNKTAAVKITGLVSGPGSIEYASAGTFTLSNPENSYTGTTVFDGASGGKFLPTCAGAIPEYEKLTYSNGKLDLQVDAEGIRWPAADAMALMTKPDYSNHGARSLNTDALTGPYVVNASAVAASFSQSPVELAVSGTNWHQSIVWEGTKALDYLYDGRRVAFEIQGHSSYPH